MTLRAWKGQISISLKEEYEEKIDRNKEEFREKSPTEELYNRIDRIIEESPTPREKAKKLRKESKDKKKEAKKWEKKANLRKTRKELRDKRQRLETVNKKIKELEKTGQKSEREMRKEIREKETQKMKDKLRTSPSDNSVEDKKDKIDRYVNAKIESWKEKQDNKEELKKEKVNLEEEIREYENILGEQ